MVDTIIFDLDGVICDSMDYHTHITLDILKRFDVTPDPSILYHKYAGRSSKDIFKSVIQRDDVDYDALAKEKFERTINNDGKYVIKPIPFVIEQIEKLSKNYKIGIASGSTREFINTIITNFQITQYIQAISSGYEVPKGKPAPDVFLDCAKKLNAEPKDCVVIEDGVAGITGAKEAGMKTIFLGRKEDNSNADIVLNSFESLNKKIERLV